MHILGEKEELTGSQYRIARSRPPPPVRHHRLRRKQQVRRRGEEGAVLVLAAVGQVVDQPILPAAPLSTTLLGTRSSISRMPPRCSRCIRLMSSSHARRVRKTAGASFGTAGSLPACSYPIPRSGRIEHTLSRLPKHGARCSLMPWARAPGDGRFGGASSAAIAATVTKTGAVAWGAAVGARAADEGRARMSTAQCLPTGGAGVQQRTPGGACRRSRLLETIQRPGGSSSCVSARPPLAKATRVKAVERRAVRTSLSVFLLTSPAPGAHARYLRCERPRQGLWTHARLHATICRRCATRWAGPSIRSRRPLSWWTLFARAASTRSGSTLERVCA